MRRTTRPRSSKPCDCRRCQCALRCRCHDINALLALILWDLGRTARLPATKAAFK